MNDTVDSPATSSTERPRSSIVVCVYNRGKEVQSCLQSMLGLKDRDFEIVLVDDCSTDDSLQRLEAFRANCPDISVRIVRNETNLGVSGARNAGIDAARGEFVLFTDSDCMVEPEWLERLVAPFSNPAVVAVGGGIINPPPTNYAERAYVGRSRIVSSIAQNRYLVGCNMAFRRETLAQFRFDDALTYGCDEDDVVRRLMACGHRTAYVADAIVHHHHRLTFRGYMKMAYRQGSGAARHWYKHGLYVGRDLLPIVLAIVTLPVGLLDRRLLLVPAALAAMQLAAIAYNEYALKGKGLIETACVFPIAVVYYVFKLLGYVRIVVALLLGKEAKIRASKAAWRRMRRQAAG